MKSQEEKTKMIDALDKQKEEVPKQSLFGDDNHAAINYQIKVINEDLDEDEIYDRELDSNTTEMAVLACQWLKGEIPDEDLMFW